MFGHWLEILLVVLVGLLVFGPKRVIQMASQLGKMLRDLRESTRDLNLNALLSSDEPQKPKTYSHTTSSSPIVGESIAQAPSAPSTADEAIVESNVTRSDDIAN